MDLKTSVAVKNHHHRKKNLINKRGNWEIRYAKCYPLLLKSFEENGGWTDTNKLYELEAATEGELTKNQIYKWFWHRRKKLGIDKSMLPIGNRNHFSKRIKSVLLNEFAKNSGYITEIELDELEETLDGELTKKQIKNWFYHQRIREGIHVPSKQ